MEMKGKNSTERAVFAKEKKREKRELTTMTRSPFCIIQISATEEKEEVIIKKRREKIAMLY